MLGKVISACGHQSKKTFEGSRKLQDAILDTKFYFGEIDKYVEQDHVYRVSSSHRLCPRAYALACFNEIPLGREIGAEFAFRLAVGSGYHFGFQTEILPSLQHGVFQGWWEKTSKGRMVVRKGGSAPLGAVGLKLSWAPQPKGKGWTYREMTGYIKEFNFRGHWDGIFEWPDEPREVLEIKSIWPDQFDSVNPSLGGEPITKHIFQSHGYMWMTGIDRCRIVYVKKGKSVLAQSIAEHVIHRDESIIDMFKERLSECKKAVNVAHDYKLKADECDNADCEDDVHLEFSEQLPPKMKDCTKRTAPMAKECFALNACIPKRGGR